MLAVSPSGDSAAPRRTGTRGANPSLKFSCTQSNHEEILKP